MVENETRGCGEILLEVLILFIFAYKAQKESKHEKDSSRVCGNGDGGNGDMPDIRPLRLEMYSHGWGRWRYDCYGLAGERRVDPCRHGSGEQGVFCLFGRD